MGGELQRLDVNNFTTKGAKSLLHGRILRGCLTSFLFRLAFFFVRRRRLVTSGISSFNGKANTYFTTAKFATNFAQQLCTVDFGQRVAKMLLIGIKLDQQFIAI